jgi:hypothetical protein
MTTYYIGADVHSNSTELAIERNKKIVQRYNLPTSIAALTSVLDSLKGEKHLAIEEGPMAGWLYRNLSKKVDNLIVCDPRRNKLIDSDGDKDDKIDAAKLACLLRGNYLRPIYHTEDAGRTELKHWVSLYQDRVRDAVRNINKIRARCRMHGISIPRLVVRQVIPREKWLSKTNNPALAAQLKLLWIGYDATSQQVRIARRRLSILSGQYQIIKFWSNLPGIGLVRATTLFAYLDTPTYGVAEPLAVQEEKQTMEILRRGSSANHQRHRQKRQAQTSPPAIALGRQQDIEKRRLRLCHKCDKSKK